MAVSKVILNGTTEIDLTGDTAVADDVMQNKTFHLASGLQATGTATGGGGSPYDFVIRCTNNTNWTSNASDYVWEVGSFDSAAAKFQAGGLVDGIAYRRTESYDDEDGYWMYNLETLRCVSAEMNGSANIGESWYDALIFRLEYVENNSTSKDVSTRFKHLTVRRNDDPELPLTYYYSAGSASGRLN